MRGVFRLATKKRKRGDGELELGFEIGPSGTAIAVAPAEQDDEDAPPVAAPIASSPPGPPIAPLEGRTLFTGEVLKQLREARGLTLREISDRTRIGVPSLSAVEDERYDELPNARIYVRGFVRCLAIELGLDANQVEKSYLRRWGDWFEGHRARSKPRPTARG